MDKNLILSFDTNLEKNNTIRGIAFLSKFEEVTAKTGKEYGTGLLKTDVTIEFKVWDKKLISFIKENDLINKPVFIEAKVNEWNGSNYLNVNEISYCDLEKFDIKIEDLLPNDSLLDKEKIKKDLYEILSNRLSENGLLLFEEIMKKHSSKFDKEFAALSVHDNCESGLINHTTKMVKIADLTLDFYDGLKKQLNNDLFFIGLAIHDIGKIMEYNNGERGEFAFLSHNALGIDIISEFKQLIINGGTLSNGETLNPFGEEFYYRLCAIILQHHGEFGENPQTVEAYAIHLIDVFESRMQILNQELPRNTRFKLSFSSFKLE